MASGLRDRPLESSWETVLAPHSLGYRFKLLSQLMSRRFQEQLEPFDLTPFHWVVLCCLWEQDGLATSAIGERLQQVGATLTGVLDRMEERGIVRRERDQRDRRIYRIWLTDEGNALRKVLVPMVLGLYDRTFHHVSPADRQHLSGLVDHMIANLCQPCSSSLGEAHPANVSPSFKNLG